MIGENLTYPLLSALGMYLLGSLSGSLLLARVRGWSDPRRAGSGNAGATNMLRIHGKAAAISVFLLDSGKAALAIWLGRALMPESSVWPSACLEWLWLFAVVLGHVFPLFFAFRGGKGMAPFIGGVFLLQPGITLLLLLMILPVLVLSRRSSVASMLALLLYFPLGVATVPTDALSCQFWGSGLAIGLILWAHRGNILRLLHGNEPAIR